jgi:hypothetical protein
MGRQLQNNLVMEIKLKCTKILKFRMRKMFCFDSLFHQAL